MRTDFTTIPVVGCFLPHTVDFDLFQPCYFSSFLAGEGGRTVLPLDSYRLVIPRAKLSRTMPHYRRLIGGRERTVRFWGSPNFKLPFCIRPHICRCWLRSGIPKAAVRRASRPALFRDQVGAFVIPLVATRPAFGDGGMFKPTELRHGTASLRSVGISLEP